MDIKSNLIEAGVPEELHEEALHCFEVARTRSKLTFWPSLMAPFVIFWVLITRQLKWEDNEMPAKWWKWGNNVSINGDSWGMQVIETGEWFSKVDLDLVNAGKAVAMPYTDPRYQGDAYYCKGRHPRSWQARFVWLGFRNRASAYSMYLGEDLDPSIPTVLFGVENPDRTSKPGVMVLRHGKIWQFYQTRQVFFGKFCLRRNLGFKINITNVKENTRAMLIYYTFSLRAWKPEKKTEA